MGLWWPFGSSKVYLLICKMLSNENGGLCTKMKSIHERFFDADEFSASRYVLLYIQVLSGGVEFSSTAYVPPFHAMFLLGLGLRATTWGCEVVRRNT